MEKKLLLPLLFVGIVVAVHMDNICAGNKRINSLLFWATAKNSKTFTNLFLKAGAGLNVKNENGMTPLHIAAKKNFTSIVRILIQNKADIEAITTDRRDVEENTPLHIATYWNSIESAVLLLKAGGANIHAKNKMGQTPLHIAAHLNYPRLVQLFVKYGARITEQEGTNNETAFHLAASKKTGSKSIKILLDKQKKSFDIRDKQGETPLHKAVHTGDFSLIKTIVDSKKIDINAMNNDGKTALDIVIEKKNKFVAAGRLIRLLEKNGAKYGTEESNNLPHKPFKYFQ